MTRQQGQKGRFLSLAKLETLSRINEQPGPLSATQVFLRLGKIGLDLFALRHNIESIRVEDPQECEVIGF